MSLLQRMERAQKKASQQAADAAATTAAGGTAAPTAPAPPAPTASTVPAPSGLSGREELLRQIRLRLQDQVVAEFRADTELTVVEIRGRVSGIIEKVIAGQGSVVTRDERTRLIEEVIDDLTGFGPIERYLKDDTITEVMVNGPDHVYIERRGKIERVESGFLNEEHVLRVIDRIITPMGRRIDESSPRVDARLPDGSRVNAIIEPLSLVGPVITVRKFSQRPYTVDDLVGFGTASKEMFDFLQACIEAKLNLFVSGGTGSGKTTTLNVLSSFIPNDERIVTIEDAAELQLRQDHIITLESRPPNLEGEGEITIRNLLRNAMHMRPDRIIVGECRAGEALDMLGAMTTGHDGSMSTGHANSPRDMLHRLETMVLMSGVDLPLRAIREQISSAVDLIVHQARLKDGSRKIVNITEVYGMEDDEVLTQDIFVFEQTGIDENGKVQGYLKPTGIRPTFMEVFEAQGVALPPDEFGIPPAGPDLPIIPPNRLKSRRGGGAGPNTGSEASAKEIGRGRTVAAGGMVYVTSVGPIDFETGEVAEGSLTEQTRACLRNLKTRLEGAGSTLEKVVWASWALRDPGDFDTFNAEWNRWFPGDAPVGQLTLMPPLQRRAGFRVSIGVIAEA
jgi:pilus assembly protein CpaF